MSLFNTDKDFNVISNMIPSGANIIDVGCGDGSLLDYLAKKKNINGRGLEIDQDKIRECLAKGIAVMQGDADIDLIDYPNKSFDYSILTYTLQATKKPKEVLEELVRISDKAIVSFPNFGYWKIRLNLLLNGTMPVSDNLSYSWYETPNLHFCTIFDFINLCEESNIKIEKKCNLKSHSIEKYTKKNWFDNFLLESGMFLISKK
jgi:methionine biosynthesis protein MetW